MNKATEIRQRIKAAKDHHLTPYPVKEWGDDIYIRPLTIAEKEALFSGLGEIHAIHHATYVVVYGVCDSEGNQVFEDSDREWLETKNAEIIERIADAILGNVEQSKKNSDTIPNNTSSTNSA